MGVTTVEVLGSEWESLRVPRRYVLKMNKILINIIIGFFDQGI